MISPWLVAFVSVRVAPTILKLSVVVLTIEAGGFEVLTFEPTTDARHTRANRQRHDRFRRPTAGELRGGILGPWIVLQGLALGSQLAFRGLAIKVCKVPTH
jgi:hypothetical protein